VEGSFEIVPIGRIKKNEKETWLEIFKDYQEGLLRLEEFSHLITLWWISKRDTPEERKVLQVHPRVKLGEEQQNTTTPLCGVFATRSPLRPNPIGLTIVKILGIENNRIIIDRHDAFDNTPLIDLKPYIPRSDCIMDVKLPAFFEILKEKRGE